MTEINPTAHQFALVGTGAALHTVVIAEAAQDVFALNVLCGEAGEVTLVHTTPDTGAIWCMRCMRKGFAMGLGK